jgi:hypothetical protein
VKSTSLRLPICFALLLLAISPRSSAQLPAIQASAESQVEPFPLVFEPNRGQANGDARFLSRGSEYTVLLGSDKTVLVLSPKAHASDQHKQRQPSVVSLEFLRSNKAALPEGLDQMPGKSNYFIGGNSANWLTGIPQYARVTYTSVYPGIDLIYHGHNGRLEYDFVLAPGADPRALRFRVAGAEKIDLDASGDLSLRLADGAIALQKPMIYQETSGARKMIAGSFVLLGDNEVGFELGNYDSRKSLVIDPVLSYSTLIGANNSTQVQGVAIDPTGNVYITGTTFATNYPAVNAFQPTNQGTTNVFITKLNPAGNTILYSTYLGGGGFDNGVAIAVDSSGSAYVTGNTQGDFPTTPGAFMTTCPDSCGGGGAFLTKVFTDGTLGYSTYMGSSNGLAIAVDSHGAAYITGATGSGLPLVNPFQTTPDGAFVQKLNPDGSALEYSTYLGGTDVYDTDVGQGIAVDAEGSAYVVGNTTQPDFPLKNPIQMSQVNAPAIPNAFITKFSPDGASLMFSTYLGGTSVSNFSYAGDFATGVGVDSLGNVHVVGTSSSCDFPLSLNALYTDCVITEYTQKVFVATLNPSGNQLLFSTFLGSGFSEGIAVDKAGDSYVTGIAETSFPLLNPIEGTSQLPSSFPPYSSNSFITELDLSGKLVFSTYLGETGGGSQTAGIALDGKGDIYVAGAGGGDFPILHPLPSQVQQITYDTFFVAKISPNNTPQFSLSPRVSPILALRNVSSVPLMISSITPSPNFTKGGNCETTLAPGTGCTLLLLGAADKKTAGAVTITSNASTAPQEFVIYKSPTGDSLGSNLIFSPAYIQFPSQLIGTISPGQQIVLVNMGLPAAINSISAGPSSAFHETNNCPTLLPSFSSCTITVTYKAVTGQDSGYVGIVADPNQTNYSVTLNGFGSTSAIVASTPSVQFGTQFVGGTPLARIVNFTNTTPSPAIITGLSTSTGFAQTNTCTAPLAPQASCRVAVTFIPTANEIPNGKLTAAGLGPGGSQIVSLYGTGLIISDLAASPLPLNLGATVGGPAGSAEATLTNTSETAMTLSSFHVAGPFTQTNDCHGNLAAGATCTLTVGFSPTQPGTFYGSVSIVHSGQGSPQIVPLVGSSRTILTVTPSPFDFGQQPLNATVTTDLVLSNNANENTTVKSITVQGAGFQFVSNGCPKVLKPYYGCGSLEVSFTPAQTGPSTGTVTVVASDDPLPHVSTLQGTGVSAGAGALSVTSLNFSAQTVGTHSQAKDLTLRNTGTGILTLGTVGASAQFSQSNTCKTTLAVGASCVISVRFAPTLQGMLVGSLTVQDDGAGSPHTVALSGLGQ